MDKLKFVKLFTDPPDEVMKVLLRELSLGPEYVSQVDGKVAENRRGLVDGVLPRHVQEVQQELFQARHS